MFTKDKSRAERFHHRNRMQIRAERICKNYMISDDPMIIHKNASRSRDNMAVCSGPCCGNPRKWFGTKTLQEIRNQYDID